MLGKKPYFLLIVFLLVFSALLYFEVINSDRFGFYHDDGIYLVTAKALATGQGYKILSLPGEPWQTKYPPVFPLALSVLWRANPDFPGNLSLFYAFSILSMLVFLALSTAYLWKKSFATPIQIALIMLFTALNWRMAILATSILSEALFAALAIGVLWLASSIGDRRVSTKSLGLGLLLALAALTRLAGISLLAAVLFYAFTQRQIRRFLLPVLLASLMIAGWFLWCHMHQSSSIGSHLAYYTDYFQDWRSLIQPAEPGIQSSLLESVLLMVGRNAVILLANIPVVCSGIQINRLQGMSEAWQFLAILIGLFCVILLIIGFCKTRLIGRGLLHFYVLAYFALHLFWSYTIYDRFLIPVLPFLLLFIFAGATHLLRGCLKGFPIHNRPAKAASLIFSCTIVMSLFTTAFWGLASGFRGQFKDTKTAYAADAREKHELTAWLKTNSLADDILLCYQDPVYSLYTGRKAIRLPAPGKTESIQLYALRLEEFIKENKATLLLRTENDFSLESYPAQMRTILDDALKCRPSYFVPIYSTYSQKSTIYGISSERAFIAN